MHRSRRRQSGIFCCTHLHRPETHEFCGWVSCCVFPRLDNTKVWNKMLFCCTGTGSCCTAPFSFSTAPDRAAQAFYLLHSHPICCTGVLCSAHVLLLLHWHSICCIGTMMLLHRPSHTADSKLSFSAWWPPTGPADFTITSRLLFEGVPWFTHVVLTPAACRPHFWATMSFIQRLCLIPLIWFIR